MLRCFHRCSTDIAQQLLPFWLIFIWKLIFMSMRISEWKVKCTIYVTKVSLTIHIAHRGLNQSSEQFPLLQRVYGLVSDCNALHPAPASAGQGGRTALQSPSLAAAPVPCPALSSMHLLLMGLAVFLLVILPSSGELVSISWLHVGDLASEIHVTAVPSDHGGWYKVPSSTSFSIATSYLRQFFFFFSMLSVVSLVLWWKTLPQSWGSEEFRPLTWHYEYHGDGNHWCSSAKDEHLIPYVDIAFQNGF